MAVYLDRTEAGTRLASHLVQYARDPSAMVLALPRGGVPVAYAVAHALMLPLDVYIVRKLGVPGHEELAMGAVASDGSYLIDQRAVELCGVTPADFDRVLARELAELKRRGRVYRGDRPEPVVRHKTVVLVDDGMATGASMIAAVTALRKAQPAQIVVAVPVASESACRMVERVADDLVCDQVPLHFTAVGPYYANFDQVGDEEVRALLRRAGNERASWIHA